MITIFDDNQYYKTGLENLLGTHISSGNLFNKTLPEGQKNIILVSIDKNAPSLHFCIDERFSRNSVDTLYFSIRDKNTRSLGQACVREVGVIYRNSSNEQTLSVIMQAMNEKQKPLNENTCNRCFPLKLSSQEITILQLIYNGLSMKTISSMLDINRRKLNAYKTKTMKKLNLLTNTELAYWLKNDATCNLTDIQQDT